MAGLVRRDEQTKSLRIVLELRRLDSAVARHRTRDTVDQERRRLIVGQGKRLGARGPGFSPRGPGGADQPGQ